MQLGERMATGLTLSQLIQMFETMATYTMEEEILTIPGTATRENDQTQFVMNKSALDELVQTLFAAQ